MKRDINHFYGMFIGGAIGDAFGGPVEDLSYEEIKELYGEEGISELVCPFGRKHAQISDDTQLTLFTAEGLIRSEARARKKKMERALDDTCTVIFRAYLRWLYTQGLQTARWSYKDYDGWLVKQGLLHAYREPGVTCITSLGRGIKGSIAHPLNESKRCGGVIRVAPIGLVEKKDRAFKLGAECAAITHGHPTAYLAAGTFALIISEIINGEELEAAIWTGINYLRNVEGGRECCDKLDRAVYLAHERPNNLEVIESLGTTPMAHDVLAMAVYAALSCADDFHKAIHLAVNHSGDSDSVASITGNLLGAYLGFEAMDECIIKKIELHSEIYELAEDLLIFYKADEKWLKKYPAW